MTTSNHGWYLVDRGKIKCLPFDVWLMLELYSSTQKYLQYPSRVLISIGQDKHTWLFGPFLCQMHVTGSGRVVGTCWQLARWTDESEVRRFREHQLPSRRIQNTSQCVLITMRIWTKTYEYQLRYPVNDRHEPMYIRTYMYHLSVLGTLCVSPCHVGPFMFHLSFRQCRSSHFWQMKPFIMPKPDSHRLPPTGARGEVSNCLVFLLIWWWPKGTATVAGFWVPQADRQLATSKKSNHSATCMNPIPTTNNHHAC